ncbi:hypothetical protein EV424DRAFT_231335 [Suillus variegatus]|nr:hypothetical protein EV424DRAFT_231335 [Suillus variegatus]
MDRPHWHGALCLFISGSLPDCTCNVNHSHLDETKGQLPWPPGSMTRMHFQLSLQCEYVYSLLCHRHPYIHLSPSSRVLLYTVTVKRSSVRGRPVKLRPLYINSMHNQTNKPKDRAPPFHLPYTNHVIVAHIYTCPLLHECCYTRYL